MVLSCGGIGFQMAVSYRKEMDILKQLIMVFDYMECELRYRLTPLPQLCKEASEKSSGVLKGILKALYKEMDAQTASNAKQCLTKVLPLYERIPQVGKEILLRFGDTMGGFDLEGQLDSLKAVKLECHRQLSVRQEDEIVRVRSYRTLGICAGAGLAVILI